MSLDFDILQTNLSQHFKLMCEKSGIFFEVSFDRNKLWEIYLESIPAEYNPIFKVRREFDCSCCKHFIEQIGGVVFINDNILTTIWDFDTGDANWDEVLKKMSGYIRSCKIENIFLSNFRKIGTPQSFTMIDDKSWKFDHFNLGLPHYAINKSNETIDSIKSRFEGSYRTFKRALDDFTLDAIDSVIELIASDSIYRGKEYEMIVKLFRQFKVKYDKLNDSRKKELFAWEKLIKTDGSTANIRNTSIGTLITNISNNEKLDVAVSKYEAIVAPSNYKRSKPIFTERMVKEAQKTITDLGYLDSLSRRYATADDITVNNILFSNRDTSKRILGAEDIFGQLSKEVKHKPHKFDRVDEIGIDEFIQDVLPTVQEVEAYVENRHASNFVSLISPEVKNSKSMFKWDNNFSWAYTGNVTDSILKQNVKKAGGSVNGVLRFSIQWNDKEQYDGNDLDAHCVEPNDNRIYFRKCRKPNMSALGGQLDIDIIEPDIDVPAVENITWHDLSQMQDGTYQFLVHCYTNRGGIGGFRAEIEFENQVFAFDYTEPLKEKEFVHVADVILKNGHFSIKEHISSSTSSRDIWNIQSNNFIPVSVICYSPNYWDEQKCGGNKHYFFMLKDCINPELPNGWYNEFLNSELYPQHRKVMEALASKAHVKETEDQLSGLGFSSTLRNDLVVKVKGSVERVLKIKF